MVKQVYKDVLLIWHKILLVQIILIYFILQEHSELEEWEVKIMLVQDIL